MHKNGIIPIFWRDGRAVECTGLENQQGLIPFQGSNPCPSTIKCLFLIRPHFNNYKLPHPLRGL